MYDTKKIKLKIYISMTFVCMWFMVYMVTH